MLAKHPLRHLQTRTDDRIAANIAHAASVAKVQVRVSDGERIVSTHLQRRPRQRAVEVGNVNDTQHDRATVALQPDLASHLASLRTDARVTTYIQRMKLPGTACIYACCCSMNYVGCQIAAYP
jgi:hypothetical protein